MPRLPLTTFRTDRMLTAALLALLIPLTSAAATCTLDRLAALPVSMVGMTPLVPVGLDGSQSLLVADSGTDVSTLSSSNAAQLHLSLQPVPLTLSVQGIGGAVHSGLTDVQLLALAGLRMHDVPFLVGGQTPFGAAGVLGQNVLAATDVEYDLPDRVIRLMHPVGCAARPLAYWTSSRRYSVLPLETSASGVAIGTATINGTVVRVLLDSGADHSMLTLRAAARANIRPDSPGVTPAPAGMGADGHELRRWSVPIAHFEIGGEQIRDTRLLIIDAGLGDNGASGFVDMLLGADFFLSHRVYIANSQHKAYFTYTGGPIFARTLLTKNRFNPCLCTPALAQASDGGTIMGKWQRHQLDFGLDLDHSLHYTLPGLIDTLTFLITQSGAHLNAPVEITGTGVSRLDFSTFVPLTTDEAASTQANAHADTHGIPGTWRPVRFYAGSYGLNKDDCEVVSEVATLLSLYTVRDIKAHLPCIPNRDASGIYGLTFQVFVPRDTPKNAVGG